MSKIRGIDIIFVVSIIALDALIYMILGLLLMGYEDNYDISKGEYWSFGSMTTSEKIVSISYVIWNVVNVFAVCFVGYRFFKYLKYRQVK